MRKSTTLLIIIFCSILINVSFAQDDPLRSWNNDSLKGSIIAFVKSVTTEGTSTFVPAEDRVATFDNDGTLWCEKPLIQGIFAMYRAKKMIGKNPALKQKQPFKAIASNDMTYIKSMSEQDLIKLVAVTHTGLTEEEYEKEVADFFANAKAPNGKSIEELVYKPQVELLQYLRANGFKTYICSGGTVDFMRAISTKYYGIPPEQVIGSTFVYVYKDSAGINDIYRTPKLNTFNDKQVKPVSIQYHIGKRPIFACGNEGGGGDIYMLRFSQGNKYPSYQLLINHDDKEREFYYQEKDNKSLNWAKKFGWNIVSMKGNWKTIFVAD
ncbi:HAD family hydrolase [Pinibacter soli]|uniref:HAD family hydrolase n=1 Tax=Pinibacter soli TaxID=3044211 RepID=A0ABT6RDT6_9BACT|nr:HAD family hydrolase [Pinibacter soli]MDI3320737.1 HAD family hydrolase [Pinibacter soli]